MTGSCCWMARTSWLLSFVDRKSVPMLVQPAYAGLVLKKPISLLRAACHSMMIILNVLSLNQAPQKSIVIDMCPQRSINAMALAYQSILAHLSNT